MTPRSVFDATGMCGMNTRGVGEMENQRAEPSEVDSCPVRLYEPFDVCRISGPYAGVSEIWR